MQGFYDSHAPLETLAGKTIGIIGYSNPGRANALGAVNTLTIWFLAGGM